MMVRCFIVGSPRSGTTLLQALLAAHSRVFSLPESHFFLRSFRGKRAFILRGFHASSVLRSWLRQIGMGGNVSLVPRLSPFRNSVVKAFLSIMDDVALREGASCWIEKTPGHVFVIEEIEKRVSNARFINIIRDGRAVVASMCDAKRRYGDAKFLQRSLGKFVSRWNRAILRSAQFVGKINHFFVSYEALTTDPKRELSAICRFLGLEFEETMLENYSKVAGQIILPQWHWVKGVTNPIEPVGLKKYHSLLSESQRKYVEKHLIEVPETLRRAMQHE